MMTNRAVRLLLCATLAIGFCFPLLGQETTGIILGSVKDSTGGLIPGAKVTVTDRETGSIRQSVTDAQGAYTVPSLPPGIYSVSVEFTGMQRASRQNVQVQLTERTPVNFIRVRLFWNDAQPYIKSAA